MRLPSRCCFETPSVNQAIMEKIKAPTTTKRHHLCIVCGCKFTEDKTFTKCPQCSSMGSTWSKIV